MNNNFVENNKWRLFQDNRGFYFSLLFISLAALILMASSGAHNGLWNDEFATIGSLRVNDVAFSDWIIGRQGSGSVAGLNFYLVAARIWYTIVPLSDNWLLLMSEIMVAVSVYFVGMTGKIIRDNLCGILAAVLYAFSYPVFEIGHEFRFYPWLVLFTAAALYYYCKTTMERVPGWRHIILFGLAMGLASNGQILAGFLPVLLFIADCVLIKKKWKKIRVLLSYLIALPFALLPVIASLKVFGNTYDEGVTYLANLGGASVSRLFGLVSNFWIREQILTGLISFIAFALGLFIIYSFVRGQRHSALGMPRQQYLFSVCAVSPAACIISNYVLTKMTGEVANIFSWRYFQYLYPLLFIAVSFILVHAFEHMKIRPMQYTILVLGIALFLAAQTYDLSYNNPKHAGIKPQTQWVIENADKIGEDALIVLPYYATNRGEVIHRLYFDGKYPDKAIEPFPFNAINDDTIAEISKKTIVTFGSIGYTDESVLSKYYSIAYKDEAMGATVWKRE